MKTGQTLLLNQTKGRIDAIDADLAGSTFMGVRLSGANFNDVNLAGATITDCNLSGWQVKNVNLSKLQISNADLGGAAIVESQSDGMTIDGVSVADLLTAYKGASTTFIRTKALDTGEAIQLKQTKRRIDAMDADLAGSTFVDVRLSGATFTDVNLAGATITDSNLSGWQVKNVNLSKLQISNADLRGVAIVESQTDDMTIDGVSVADLMAAYRAYNGHVTVGESQ